jgi:ADP-ribosylglycohydrolase/tetratricopeptide (TPR) repeat protein
VSIFTDGGEWYQDVGGPVRLFTNRFQAVRAVAARINDDPPARTVTYFIGVAGSGKSSLMRHIREHCCFRLAREDWREVTSYADEVFKWSLARAPSAQPVPVAYIDFGMRPDGEYRPQEPLGALFMLKRQLSRYKVRTPRFDLAALTYYRKSGTDVSQRLPALFPPSEQGLAAEMTDALLSLPVLRSVMDLSEAVERRLDEVFRRRRVQQRVSREIALRILSMPGEPDLADALPGFFAADLADSLTVLGEHERIVLMFDTYEALLGEAVPGADGYAVDPYGPRWFRSLLGNLPTANGVVPIVAGRIRPGWAGATSESIPDRFVEFRPVGPLGTEFADRYLATAGVDDAAFRAALVDYASIAPGQVYALLLGLCADLLHVAETNAVSLDASRLPGGIMLDDKTRRMTGRLLSWADPGLASTVTAMSACRSFDLALFRYLGDVLGFPHDDADFARLTAFSFVAPTTRAVVAAEPRAAPSDVSGAYEVHRVLRQTLSEIEPVDTRAAHRALIDYFEAGSEHLLNQVEATYYRNQVDPRDGVRAWLDAMRSALALGRYDYCRTYVALLPDLEVETEQERHACVYASARAAIGLGRWADAETMLQGLPEESGHALLLKADLAFLRGQFVRSEELTKRALAAAPGGLARLPFLFRVAELYLYLGYHLEARALCAEAEQLAARANERVVSANEQARFLFLDGEVAFFAGDLDAARDSFRRAHETIESLDNKDRDQALQANLRQDDALVSAIDGDWAKAVRASVEALEIRRKIADARGIAHSLNGLGIAQGGSGDIAAAEASFSQAAEAAAALGDDLLVGKISRASGEAAMVAGRYNVAQARLDRALVQLTRVGIDYDVAHAQLTLARLKALLGDHLGQVALWDEARRVIESRTYLSLYTLFPEARPPSAAPVREGLIGFATGDAVGVPWEGRRPDEIVVDDIAKLPTREGWPRGATSDDTEALLVVADHLIATQGKGDARGFLTVLGAARDDLRGIGETTQAALDRFAETGKAERASTGATNGALVRGLPIGWAYPLFRAPERRVVVELITTTTHGDEVALAAAQAIAAMAAVAVEGVPVAAVLAAGLDELNEQVNAHPGIAAPLEAVRHWTPGPDGVPMSAAGTFGAVLHLLDRLPAEVGLADAQVAAVALGGDTDSVAAVLGGILACRASDASVGLPWTGQVALADPGELDRVAQGLHELRRATYRGQVT